jgi:transposase
MNRTRPYPAQFRQQMVELVRAGRVPAELAREFGCSANSILGWCRQAQGQEEAREAPPGTALSPDEREELKRLRRENRELQIDREILAKATAWFAAKSEKTPTSSSNS